MLEDGLLERFPCEAIYGMHNCPACRSASSAPRRRHAGRQRFLDGDVQRHRRPWRRRRPPVDRRHPGPGAFHHWRPDIVSRNVSATGHRGHQRRLHRRRRRGSPKSCHPKSSSEAPLVVPRFHPEPDRAEDGRHRPGRRGDARLHRRTRLRTPLRSPGQRCRLHHDRHGRRGRSWWARTR